MLGAAICKSSSQLGPGPAVVCNSLVSLGKPEDPGWNWELNSDLNSLAFSGLNLSLSFVAYTFAHTVTIHLLLKVFWIQQIF